jgi:hypothetical protein
MSMASVMGPREGRVVEVVEVFLSVALAAESLGVISNEL